MKDLSFFFLKNSFGVKMRKGIRNFCNGDGSTSTLNQQNVLNHLIIKDDDDIADNNKKQPATLEEMILQLELEEEISRSKLAQQQHDTMRRRMSCVNNSDILRSARNALNQYPRFSLDGKDAMYRSSFRNLHEGRKSVCCDRGVMVRERLLMNKGNIDNLEKERRMRRKSSSTSCLPASLGGESVVWCKPGVIAKLMGLDAMPVPLNTSSRKETLNSVIKRQNLRRRVERHEMERKDHRYRYCNYRSSAGMHMAAAAAASSSTSSNTTTAAGKGYCVMKPIAIQPPIINDNDEGGWPTRRFHPKNNQL